MPTPPPPDTTHCDQPMIGVEYAHGEPGHYDGVSEWRCQVCGLRVGRWSGRVLTGDDYERPYGIEEHNHAFKQGKNQ